MSIFDSAYVLHGTVAPEHDLQKPLELYRKDKIDGSTGKPIPACELWRVESTTGPLVTAINSEHTRFRREDGTLYVLMTQG